MSFFTRVKSTAEMLRLLRRPTVPLPQAQARYDPMILALAEALTAEFGVTWSVDTQAEVDHTGRRWEYTTQRLTSTRRLDSFADWSTRYNSAVQSVAEATQLGTQGYDPKPSAGSFSTPAESHPYRIDDDIEVVAMGPADIGPSRVTRDALGGDIEMDIDADGTMIAITVAVVATRA